MKTVLITGVSSGIGLGLAQKFLNNGYHVFGSVRTTSKAEKMKAQLGSNYTPLVFELTDYDAIDEAAKFVERKIGDGYLTGLINNAGASEIAPLLYLSLNDFRKELEILTVSQLYVIQRFASLLLAPDNIDTENGRIVNISSVSGVSGNFGYGAYSAAKHALEGMSKTLRMELWGFYKIKVIVIGPGNVKTPLWDKQVSGAVEKYKDTPYYQLLKNKIKLVGTKSLLDSMVSVEEFSAEFLKIFENKNPHERYTIKKIKLFLGKNKTRAWKSTPFVDRVMAKLSR